MVQIGVIMWLPSDHVTVSEWEDGHRNVVGFPLTVMFHGLVYVYRKVYDSLHGENVMLSICRKLTRNWGNHPKIRLAVGF